MALALGGSGVWRHGGGSSWVGSVSPLPAIHDAAANAPRLGSVASGVPVGVCRSPRKVRLLRRAPPRLRPVAAGAPDGFGAGVDLSVDRICGDGGVKRRVR